MVVGTDPLGGRLLLQRHAALPGRGLSGADHTVDLLQTVGGAAADVVVDLVSGGGRRGGGACLVRRDVDGVFTGQKHPTGGTSPQGGVRTQGGVSTPAEGELAEYLRAKGLICLM